MIKRLKYVDMVRGIAVLWMIVFQLFDMFSKDFGLYATHYYTIKYVNWFPMFIIVAGFSLELMFDNYDTKTFYLKVLRRFLLFALVSWFMIFWCQFKVNPLLFDGEIIGAIGLNLAFLSLFFLVESLHRSKFLRVAWFGSWCIIMVTLNGVMQIQPGFFGVFWLQSFMMFGVLLATLRNHSITWLLSSLVLLMLGLFSIGAVDLWNRNIQFLFMNWGFTGLLLSILRTRKMNLLGGVLSYFGRHALFFYVLHYAFVYKVLLLTDSVKTFGIFDSVLLTLVSVLVLIVLHKSKTYIESHTNVLARLVCLDSLRKLTRKGRVRELTYEVCRLALGNDHPATVMAEKGIAPYSSKVECAHACQNHLVDEVESFSEEKNTSRVRYK